MMGVGLVWSRLDSNKRYIALEASTLSINGIHSVFNLSSD
jgi:hypothetical protein